MKPVLVTSSSTIRTYSTRKTIKKGGTYHQNIDSYKLPLHERGTVRTFCESNGIVMGKCDKYGDYIYLQEDEETIRFYLNYFQSKTGRSYIFGHNRRVQKTINISKLIDQTTLCDLFMVKTKKNICGFFQNTDVNYIISI